MQNIVLIGMPGSGKTTVGKLLSQITGKEFVDADAYLEHTVGESIPEIFEKYGEAEFRKLETQTLSELGKRSGLVIATGGGCVTRQENYPLLHQNGRLIWLQRDITLLPTCGRPLSQQGNLLEMYAIRKSMYESFSDITIENNADPTYTAREILLRLQMEA